MDLNSYKLYKSYLIELYSYIQCLHKHLNTNSKHPDRNKIWLQAENS